MCREERGKQTRFQSPNERRCTSGCGYLLAEERLGFWGKAKGAVGQALTAQSRPTSVFPAASSFSYWLHTSSSFLPRRRGIPDKIEPLAISCIDIAKTGGTIAFLLRYPYRAYTPAPPCVPYLKTMCRLVLATPRRSLGHVRCHHARSETVCLNGYGTTKMTISQGRCSKWASLIALAAARTEECRSSESSRRYLQRRWRTPSC